MKQLTTPKKLNCFRWAGIVLAFMFASSDKAIGQDIHYSQYMYSPLNLNPALTGDFNGNFRAVINHRNQWNSISVPYLSSAVASDIKKWDDRWNGNYAGFGIVVQHDKSGEGALQQLQPMLSVAFKKFLDANKEQAVALGLRSGVMKKWIDFSKLTFPNQFDEGDFHQSIPSGEDESHFSITKFDLDAGVVHFYKKEKSPEIKTGYALSHINRPNQSLLRNSNRIALHHAVFSEVKIPASKSTTLNVQLLYTHQKKANEWVIGGNLENILESNDENSYLISGGLSYRVKDAILIYAGFGFDKWRIGFSYDVNVSGLKRASHSRGAYEISIIYIDQWISGRKNIPIIVPCHRL